jgi:predicted PurR-regulated permease PerM
MPETSSSIREYPFYIKASASLLGIVLFCFILKILASILVPLVFSILISILLNPLFARLDRRMNRIVAIMLTLLIASAVLLGLIYFLSTRVASFANDLPLIQQKLYNLLNQVQVWVDRELGFSLNQQVNTVKKTISGGNPAMLSNTLSTIVGMLGVLFLMPVYIFLIFYYKTLILQFLFEVFSEQHSLRVAEILSQTKAAIQSFMIGLMWETLIVSILNSAALLLIGVPNAVVVGVIGGILNILPYVGGVIAIGLAVLMSLISSNDFSQLFLIVGAYSVIQFIDNNILVPRIVSSKVQINALISIIVVLLGGLLWGISGMFLSIPLIAVCKIIFDRIDDMKPWGRLLGDEVPTEHIGVVWQKRWDRIFRRIQKDKEQALSDINASKEQNT